MNRAFWSSGVTRQLVISWALGIICFSAQAQDISGGRQATPADSKAANAEPRRPLAPKVARSAPVWEILGQLQTPESVYFEPSTKNIYVSNINGSPTGKDGNGWIGIVHLTKDGAGPDGVEKMVEGLNAPKGLRAFGGTLWVTDIDELIGISQSTRQITQRIKVPDAMFLNDIAIDEKGTIYVSDTLTSSIHVIQDGKPAVFMAGKELASPNGLLWANGKLYVAAWGLITDPETFGGKDLGHLYSVDVKTRKITNITTKPLGHLDGLERTKSGNFIVSDWQAGTVHKIDTKGRATLLYQGIKNAADLAIKDQLVLVPAMSGNSLNAYQLK